MNPTAGCDNRTRLHIDLETFSSVDIKAGGAFRYMEAPDFEIMLIAYAWDDSPVKVLDMLNPSGLDAYVLRDIMHSLTDPNIVKVAHNCAFERAALRRHTGQYMPPEQWEDTMLLSSMNGLPASLDESGAALDLDYKKIKEGTTLISYFCKPCKPTGANGGRTRNLPKHAPDKWQRFIEYCRRDVEAEKEIYYKLRSFPIPDWERKVFALDARINERGVMIDRELVEAAVAVDAESREKSLQELQKLTGLENPNSVQQLRQWLEYSGVSVDKLDKGTISEQLKAGHDSTVCRVLELRQLLGKTSTKKYDAMLAAASPQDNRIRGMMQYYGAGRTGRWAGRIVQPQNLPQNHLDNIGAVREMVRDRDLDFLSLLYPNVPDTLSQLIRTALIAKPGCTFLVADYSAIEARVIAYLAGCQWRMDVFKNGGDIYCSSASQMFKVPVVKHGVNGHLRQKGKIAELACIAEGQLVLTDSGLIPIEKVTKSHKVWDGIEWVSHDGVVYRGEKEVIKYGRLEATTDHTVWVTDNGKYRTVRFGEAAASCARLAVSAIGGTAVRLGDCDFAREAMERQEESLPCFDEVQQLRQGKLGNPRQSAIRKVEGVPELFSAQKCSALVRQKVHRCEAEMHESERCELQELWCERDSIQFSKCSGCLYLHDRNAGIAGGQGNGTGPNRCEWELRARESSVGNTSGELPESKKISKVYDIVNAGPRHRFTVSGVLVHNCGYGGGINALLNFGADKMGLTTTEMQEIVDQWRAASPEIPKFWRTTEQAAISALQTPGKAFRIPCGCTYYRDRHALRLRLPSGRVLSYWGAFLDDDGSIRFMAQNQITRKWDLSQTWGGKLVENIVQAYARDCLAVAMLRLDAEGYNICFSVHDELIVEEPKDGRTWQQMADIMGLPIDWAPGLLLRADGYQTDFYMKD